MTDEELARDLCGTGCGCEEDDAEHCAFMQDGVCRRQGNAIFSALTVARAEEREACADVADEHYGRHIAAAIRARSGEKR